MKKYLALLLLAFSLFALLGFFANSAAHNKYTSFQLPTPTPTPKEPVTIEKLELNKKEVIIPCPPIDFVPAQCICYIDDRLVKVFTSVSNPQNRDLSFEYTVSGGHVIGSGQNVDWDLSRVRPGTYTISVAIDAKGRASNETKSQEVEVRACNNCDPPCRCPSLSVLSANNTVKAGETIVFNVNVKGSGFTDIRYNWTISDGEIIEGQGTPQIEVKTTSEMAGKKITAKVEIGGLDPACSCETMASETVLIVSEEPK